MKNFTVSTFFLLVTLITAGCDTGNDDKSTISVITREDGSGTRGAFVEIVGLLENKVDQTSTDAIVHDGTGKVMTAVKNDPNSIGYISLGSLNSTVKALSIDGAFPTNESIKNNEYKVARPFNLVMKEHASPLAADFINYINSTEAQKIVNTNGYISVPSNNGYKSTLESGTIVIGGSTSVYPLIEKLSEAYKASNPNANINIEAIGSSAGIKGAIDGTFDIGMASRELSTSEKSAIPHFVIALDGIAIIVNSKNPVNNLSRAQLKSIYKNEITSFSDIQ